MISDARNGHVSPGIYTEEKDVVYSVKSLGITSLGLVGETLYGPAFENIEIKNWTEFVDYFGGTSPIKFKESGKPKYELPYIAKSYLEESNRLNVVRVLGLSGYDAGPVWVVKDTDENPIVILRSKMTYKSNEGANICDTASEGKASQVVTKVSISEYIETAYDAICQKNDDSVDRTISGETYFHLTVETNGGTYSKTYEYNLTLDPSHSNYIYNVLSSKPDTGTTPIYIDAVYENALKDGKSIKIEVGEISPISDITTTIEKYYKVNSVTSSKTEDDKISYTYELEETQKTDTVKEVTGDIPTNSKEYVSEEKYSKDDVLYFKERAEIDGVYRDYKEAFRPAITPWIVSNASVTKSDTTTTAIMNKLFRFVTISDGDAANYQVKVSIQNIRVEDGTFDVVVRDFNDTDIAPIFLERFSKCNLVEGDSNFIGFKIGTIDGGYKSKSKYILVEMADGENLMNSVPAGFLGYPSPKYECDKCVEMTYNIDYRPEIKAKKQYFGISNLAGVDVDMFSYKGKYFYNEKNNVELLSNGFHMDSAINSGTTCYVDGVSGYNFTSVSDKKVTAHARIPRLINAEYIQETIYSDVKTRKFTVCFYGGFDGWDVNRSGRTNTDEYKATIYSVEKSEVFERYKDESGLYPQIKLPSTAITSDYYAYLAGYRLFANPQDIDINLFATPGIDWSNNTLLTEEVIDMIEDSEDGRRGDALYIMASPNNMDATELAEKFEEVEINSSYACTYAPWVMYYDSSNKRYLDLPVTKDVVRNMASTDNNSYPWFAPAGMERGNVNCIKAEYKTTLANEDELYENRINPVKTFAQDGVKIWGNKTAYNMESPLNRINVRRLMIRVKKLVTNAAKNLIFTQYDDTLEKQFRGLIDPILADVKSNRGISDYRIITEVTPETKDQHILPAKILIKPTPALEYISISFVVYPESVSFDEN